MENGKLTELNNYLAENHLEKITEEENLTSHILNKYPTDLYINRNIETLLKNKILEYDRLFITGWAGSGKTSLLLYTLHKELNDNFDLILYFDFDNKTLTDINKTEEEILDAPYTKLINYYCGQSDIYKQYLYFCAITQSDFNLASCRTNIQQIIGNDNLNNYALLERTINNLSRHDNHDKVETSIEEELNQNRNMRLHAISKFIRYYLKKHVLIIYDNIDPKNLDIQKKILTIIKNNIFNNCNTNFKVITLIRNVKIFSAISRATNQSFRVGTCAISNFSPHSNKTTKDLFQEDNTIIYDIYIQKIKMSKILNETDQKDIFTIIHKLKSEDQNLKYLRLNIFKLSNHSIRFALQFINEFIFWVLEKDFDIRKKNATFFHSLFYAFVSQENELSIQGLNPLTVIKSVENNFSSLGCDIDYLILTRLLNSSDYLLNFNKLYQSFQQLSFTLTEDILKSSLMNLSKNGNKNINLLGIYGHIIFLHNPNKDEIICQESMIDANTIISLMPRAEAMILASFKFTFSNFLYLKSENTYFKEYNNKLDGYFEKQYILFTRLYTVHLIELYRMFQENPSIDCLNEYKKVFGFNIKHKDSNNNKLQLENLVTTNLLFLNQLKTKKVISKELYERYTALFNQILTQFQDSYKSFTLDEFKIPNLLLQYLYTQIKNNKQASKNFIKNITKDINLQHYFNNPDNLKLFNELFASKHVFNLTQLKNLLKEEKNLRYFDEDR